MGGRGGASGVDLSYQGKNGGSGRATSAGVNVSQMSRNINKVNANALSDARATEALEQIRKTAKESDKIKIYRATVGDSINTGDWVFLSRAQAEKWTRTAFGTQKPGVKVIESTVTAKDVDWTGKNLEFVFKGKSRKKR